MTKKDQSDQDVVTRQRPTPHATVAAAIDYRSHRFNSKGDGTKARIRELLLNTDMTYEQIGKAVGLSGMTVYAHCRKMLTAEGREAETVIETDHSIDELAEGDIRSQEEQDAKMRAARPRLK